jgi:hypothetical protein
VLGKGTLHACARILTSRRKFNLAWINAPRLDEYVSRVRRQFLSIPSATFVFSVPPPSQGCEVRIAFCSTRCLTLIPTLTQRRLILARADEYAGLRGAVTLD